MDQHLQLDYQLTLLEIQELAYFLQVDSQIGTEIQTAMEGFDRRCLANL
jgi:hypothetical protein